MRRFVEHGRCEACKGGDIHKIEMDFLRDNYVPCDVWKGRRYNRETWRCAKRAGTSPRCQD